MSFNLITARWLPCRRADGGRTWIAPHEITSGFADNPILTLDFPRPDWNAAITELLIGCLSATMPPPDADAWADAWIAPPSPEKLQSALAPLAFAFNLDGDGPLCFQDFALPLDAKPNGIRALLIDAPGENTVRENKDLFVKRAGMEALSLPYAAAALITLQTYAPSGGQGNRTSMRGGGPLTLLLAPRRRHQNHPAITTLWDFIWSNVREDDGEVCPLAATLPRDDKRWPRAFPWLSETRASKNDIATLQEKHADPLQAYFGMPRRIRLDIEPASDLPCSLDGPVSHGIVRTYRSINYGIMYSGWRHPLSPYYVDNKNGLLPLHPQPGLATYADWLAWWGLKDGTSAANVKLWRDRYAALAAKIGDLGETRQHVLHAFGFDMDNMKARDWLDQRIPYFEPKKDAPVWAQQFQGTVTQMVAGAKAAANQLKYELRRNLFAKWDGKQFKLLDNAPKNACDEVAAAFWAGTEADFVKALAALHDGDPQDLDRKTRSEFLKVLRAKARDLFDAASNMDSLAEQNVRRLVEARKGLEFALSDSGKVASELGLAVPKPKGKGRAKGGAT